MKHNNKRKSNRSVNPRVSGRNGVQVLKKTHTVATADMRKQCFSGSDFIGRVRSAPAEDAEGSPSPALRALKLVGTGLTNTRLQRQATLFERYRFKRAAIRYVPLLPTTYGGQVLGYIDTDPRDAAEDLTLNLDEALRVATAHANSKQWSITSPQTISLPAAGREKWLYTGAETDSAFGRFTHAGVFKLFQLNTLVPTLPAATQEVFDLPLGALYLDWEVEFSGPQLEPMGETPAGPGPEPEDLSLYVHSIPLDLDLTSSRTIVELRQLDESAQQFLIPCSADWRWFYDRENQDGTTSNTTNAAVVTTSYWPIDEQPPLDEPVLESHHTYFAGFRGGPNLDQFGYGSTTTGVLEDKSFDPAWFTNDLTFTRVEKAKTAIFGDVAVVIVTSEAADNISPATMVSGAPGSGTAQGPSGTLTFISNSPKAYTIDAEGVTGAQGGIYFVVEIPSVGQIPSDTKKASPPPEVLKDLKRLRLEAGLKE